jgi:hypothetical protein
VLKRFKSNRHGVLKRFKSNRHGVLKRFKSNGFKCSISPLKGESSMVVRCHGDSCACTASLNGCVWAVSSVPFARFTGCGVSCEKLWKTLTMGGCSKQGII